MIIQCGAKRQHDIEQFRKGISDPSVFKDSQRRIVDPGEVLIAQRPVLSAGMPGWIAGLLPPSRRACAFAFLSAAFRRLGRVTWVFVESTRRTV